MASSKADDSPVPLAAASGLTIALLPFGFLIEDFLDKIKVSLEVFCTEMTGGWLFGYMEALRSAGVRTVLICCSSRVTEPARFLHKPSGMTVWVLPSPPLYLAMRRSIRKSVRA